MILNCTILFQIFLGEYAPKPPYSKGHGFTVLWLCAAYFFDKCKFTFQKKILTLLSNSVYSPGIHINFKIATLYKCYICVNNACKLVKCIET